LHLEASVNPGWYTHYIFAWSPGTNLDDSSIQNVVFTPGDSSKLIVFVTTPAGCKGGDSLQIIVHPANFASLDTDVNLCPNDSVQFKPTGGVSYIWHPGMYLSDSTSGSPWVHAITSLAYSVIAKSQFNCLDTLGVRVVVQPAGVLNLGDSVTLYPGETYQVNPQTNCSSFTWFPPAGLSSDNVSNPLISSELSTKYTVQGITSWGCIAIDSIFIYVDISSLLALPNAFTPDAGINNKLMLLKRGIATLNYFRIYNRWGNLVYGSSNIDDGWDGSFHGTPQPYDVYVYEIEAVTNTGTVFHKQGNVTLIR
jgi:gliding motility-associated-like protein